MGTRWWNRGNQIQTAGDGSIQIQAGRGLRMTAGDGTSFTYEGGLAYIRIAKGQAVATQTVNYSNPKISIDLDANGKAVGIGVQF